MLLASLLLLGIGTGPVAGAVPVAPPTPIPVHPAAPRAPHALARYAEPPALVVVLTVDQLIPTYLSQWEAQLTGGLGRLVRGGLVYTQAFQDHAITETAPGHASVLSGRFPYSTGIAANAVGVNTDDAPLLGTHETGASPARFRGTTFADWLTAADPDSRVLSVSRKDRGAILPVGRGRHEVYWYARSTGRFTTSTWYADTLPAWVTAFNDERHVFTRYAGRTWDLLLPDSAYTSADSIPGESFGQDFVFPYTLPSDSMRATSMLIAFPFMDEFTLDFAWRGVRERALGQRGHTDLLAVSLSTTDAVGHRWGPDSREMQDHILRLDRALGTFLDSLATVVPRERLLVVLTSDHGMAPSPEVRSARMDNRGARRVYMEEFQAAINDAATVADRAGIPLDALGFDGFTLTVDTSLVRGKARELRRVAEAFTRTARRMNGVLRADVLEALARTDTTTDHIARRWLHMFRPGGEVIAVVTLQPFHVLGENNPATHGSPHDYDAHVPLVFWGADIAAARDDTVVRVVDIGPTLARRLGLRVLEPVDGRVLPAIAP
jgi:predicted AlkP superfamily pyrophosphatase or phosphodiesterase